MLVKQSLTQPQLYLTLFSLFFALLALLLAGPELRRVTRGVLVLRALRKHAPAVPEQWVVERDRDVGEDVVRYLR